MFLARCWMLAVGLCLAAAPAARGAVVVPVNFSGGSGAPLTITLPLSITYVVTSVPAGGILFDFKSVGNLFGGTVNVSGAMTYTTNGGAPNTITAATTATTAAAIAPTDLLLYHNPATSAAQNDTIVLSGSVTTTNNFAGAPPASGLYTATLVDQSGSQVGIGVIPEPGSITLLAAGAITLLTRRRKSC